MRWAPLALMTACAGFAMLLASGCEGDQTIEVSRSSCLACHRPLQKDGKAHGIERAHPPVKGKVLTCVQCHGGNNKARKQSEAHVSPGRNASTYIRNLTIGELDDVKLAYLRFINPGDLRVADQACGTKECHQSIIEKVKTNPMATFSGELSIARYRAGIQNSGESVKAIYDVRDPSYVFGKLFGTVGALVKMVEPRVPKGETHVGVYQDLYLTKACMRCHIWSFGDNKFPGDFRSSGCTACHMNYRNDGLSKSNDPHVDKQTPPHPARHVLTNKITTEQCMHCHYRGGRIGPNYLGFRESGGPGTNPKKAGFLNQSLHGHDAKFYITDEDLSNKRDETPPDVHRKAGMVCIDCHGTHDVHGDGHLYTQSNLAVGIRCEDCHGSLDKVSDLKNSVGQRLKQLSRDAQGNVWLTTKLTGKKLKVTQIKNSVAKAHPKSYLHRLMGRDPKTGFSHMDKIACSTCHSTWIPNCYGCHVKVDMRGVQRSLISGHSTPGRISGTRRWVTVDDMILMLNVKGQISLSMPSERMFLTAIDGSGKTVVNNQVRTGPRGQVGHGQRSFNPHTVQRWSPFMRCERCHPTSDKSNQSKLDLAMGFGTDRFIEKDGDGKTYKLDQIQTKDFKPTVLIGHDVPKVSRPLPKSIVDRMMKYVVQLPKCPDPKATVTFAQLQKQIFDSSCVSCHNSKDPQGSLDLSEGKSYAALVGKSSSQQRDKKLVEPGKPDESYLYQKLIDRGEVTGLRMPTQGDYLRSCQLQMVQQWIEKGAKK